MSGGGGCLPSTACWIIEGHPIFSSKNEWVSVLGYFRSRVALTIAVLLPSLLGR